MASNPLYIMQNSFTGGEFSPVMDARQDLEKYATGLSTMKNFYALPHGAATNRPGTYFKAESKDSTKRSRLIPFQFSEEQAYNIEFGHLYCRFYRNGGQVESSPGVPYEIVTPYIASDLARLKFTQSADVLYLTHPNYAPMMLSRFADTSWTITENPFHDGPFMPVNLSATTITPSGVIGSITLTASASLFNSLHVGALWKLEHDVEAQALSTSLSAVGATSSVRGRDQWKVITHGTWSGKIYLEKSEDNGSTWKVLRTYSSAGDFNANDSGTEDDIVLLRLRAYSWSSGTANVDLSWFSFTAVGIVEITAVTDATHATATVKKELGATTATDIWREGSWSDYRGYPAAVVFFQNRLFYGFTKAEPQTPWGSKTGDYNNFGTSTPSVDDDAVTVPLISRQVNAIRSLVALDKIIAMTASGHWKIGAGGDNAALTPTSVTAVQQGYYGASYLDPLVIGNRILYTQQKGSAVRDVGYDFQSDSYTGSDLTLLAEHLFRNRQIVEWAFQQEPNGILWCVCDDGTLLGFTYLIEQNVWGWHRHETDGFFESVSVIPGEDRDEVWFIVRRTIDGVTKRYIEQMASRNISTQPEDQYFVDCGLSYDGTATAAFGGLDHLEGKEVSILADGNVHPHLVVTDGAITLNYAASKVHVGLPYNADLETLNVDFPGRDGTIQTRFKKIPEVTVRVENTRNAYIGSTFDTLYELKMRSNENYDTAIALFSGDKTISLTGGSTRQGRVCIRMSEPLPITVLAIVSKVALDA
jgi:hypothetical protein